MIEINYVTGDATNPIGEGNKIVPHVCNNENKWGAGFVLALSKKWKQPEIAYRMQKDYTLGNVQFVRVENDIIVANMVAQNGVIHVNGIPPIRYDALKTALIKVNQMAIETNSTIHCPKFGAGLSGGRWDIIEEIIKEVITVPVTVYNYEINN